MSLDIDLMVVQPMSVHSQNITHNLGKMAGAVDVGDHYTLYNVLWRPDEMAPPRIRADELIDYLSTGLNVLLDNREQLLQYNPDNGWGSYDNLLNFTRDYLQACIENPQAQLRISR